MIYSKGGCRIQVRASAAFSFLLIRDDVSNANAINRNHFFSLAQNAQIYERNFYSSMQFLLNLLKNVKHLNHLELMYQWKTCFVVNNILFVYAGCSSMHEKCLVQFLWMYMWAVCVLYHLKVQMLSVQKTVRCCK